MTFQSLCYRLLLLSSLSLPVAAQTVNYSEQPVVVSPKVIQSMVLNGPSAPITLTLPAVPTVGNMLIAIVGDHLYTSRVYNPPDASWTCSRELVGYIELKTCTHVIVSGDGTSYTFVPTTTDGGGSFGFLLEASGVVSAQAAYSYNVGQGNQVVTSTPSMTPSSIGMLAISATFGGQLAQAGDAKWTTLQSISGMGVFALGTLTTDTTTPISTTFNYIDSNLGDSIQELLLLTPGTFLATPAASLPSGGYPTMQQVVLTDPSPTAVIHYTLDTTAPTCSSPTYSSPIAIGGSATVSFVACAPGYANSAIVVANYVIAGGTLAGISLGPLGDLNGYVPFAGDLFHTDISAVPVDSNSGNILSGIGANSLHHDWSSVNGGNYGIPYTVVDSSVTPLSPFLNQLYSDESDLTLYPIPATLAVESTPPPCTITGDNHAIMLDKHTGVEYEFYQAQYCPGSTPTWQVSNGVLWDMTINEKRPYTYTSVDAAGLSVFEGLVRYDEIVAGAINHAIRFTTAMTRCDHYDYGDGQGAFVAPATHAACNNSGTLNIMGMRIRLKASFDVSGFSPTNQIILNAMKKYGMILADNGSSLYFQGTPDARWNDDDLHALDYVSSSSFEVIQMPTVMSNDSHPTGAAPVINGFAPVSSTIFQGQSVTLSAAVTGASYSYIDNAGFLRGSTVTVSPAQTTTYTLTSRNAFGTTSASTTVTVVTAPYKDPSLAFAPVAAQTVGNAPFTVSTSSQSSGQVTYSVVSGPATIAGKTVTINGAGTVVLESSQASSGIYLAATATATFQVTGLAPGLAFAPVADVVYGVNPFLVSAHSSSPATITYSVASGGATMVGRSVTVESAGVVSLQATVPAASQYAGATVQTTFTVKPATPLLSFVPIANRAYGAAPFTISSVSNSSGGDTYSVVSGPATIEDNAVTITGIGKVTLKVSQVASGNYTAGSATTSFSVSAAVPKLSFNAIPTKIFGSAPFAVKASSASPGAITYQLVSGPAALAGNTVTLNGAGTVTLLAVQAAAPDYTATDALVSFAVTPANITVALQVPVTEVPYLTPLNFTVVFSGPTVAKTGPTGSVEILDGTKSVGIYAVKPIQGGLLAGTPLTGLTVGQHVLTAVYSGDANYLGSLSTTVRVLVDQLPVGGVPRLPHPVAGGSL